ncbi:hypothetical protein [Streptomyces sp. 061-3]|uniref:hypothetical protein n=1 Tax=Streptomyces sp. 061-3 TaxID=2789268 RepID=UPI0039814281
MPRRGEYRGDFPPPAQAASPGTAPRIGVRQAVALEPGRRPVTVTFDPSGYVSSQLAAELADDWVELMAAAMLSVGACRGFRKAISTFCTYLDSVEPKAAEASLAAVEPDLHAAVTEWIRLLPAAYRAGSPSPAWLASRLRQLIARRIAHPDRPVAGHLHGWVKGALGVSKGQCVEVDEFSRADKKRLIQAAWAARRVTEERIRKGWALADVGRDPRVDGWAEPANLLWALAHGVWTCEDIAERLPPFAQWPAPLRKLLPPGILPQHTVNCLLRNLIGMLYPHNLDLHAYRILLMAATGRTSEEVVALHEDDPVAPTRCLECRNAFILPSNLPQLLLFAAHLEQLRHRLAPRHFHTLWGQSQANLTEALGLRTDAEIARARQRIADEGLTLQLPISSQVEFDV